MKPERRVRRSHDPLVALHYQLAEARRHGAMDVLVVADPSGTVLAGAGSWPLCEELAAYAPLLVHVPGGDEGGRIAELRAEVSVKTVTIDECPVLLCARSADGSRGGEAELGVLETTAEGVRRILATAA